MMASLLRSKFLNSLRGELADDRMRIIPAADNYLVIVVNIVIRKNGNVKVVVYFCICAKRGNRCYRSFQLVRRLGPHVSNRTKFTRNPLVIFRRTGEIPYVPLVDDPVIHCPADVLGQNLHSLLSAGECHKYNWSHYIHVAFN